MILRYQDYAQVKAKLSNSQPQEDIEAKTDDQGYFRIGHVEPDRAGSTRSLPSRRAWRIIRR